MTHNRLITVVDHQGRLSITKARAKDIHDQETSNFKFLKNKVKVYEKQKEISDLKRQEKIRARRQARQALLDKPLFSLKTEEDFKLPTFAEYLGYEDDLSLSSLGSDVDGNESASADSVTEQNHWEHLSTLLDGGKPQTQANDLIPKKTKKGPKKTS